MFIQAEDKEYNRAEDAQNDALANWDAVTQALKDSGIAFEDLTDSQRLKLTQLEVQGGLNEGTSAFVLQAIDQEKEVFTKTYSPDKTQLIVSYKDGTTDVFETGFIPEPEDSDDVKITDATRVSNANTTIQQKQGSDKKIAWETYVDMARDWISQGGTVGDLRVAFPPETLMNEGNLKLLPSSLRPKLTNDDDNLF